MNKPSNCPNCGTNDGLYAAVSTDTLTVTRVGEAECE